MDMIDNFLSIAPHRQPAAATSPQGGEGFREGMESVPTKIREIDERKKYLLAN